MTDRLPTIPVSSEDDDDDDDDSDNDNYDDDEVDDSHHSSISSSSGDEDFEFELSNQNRGDRVSNFADFASNSSIRELSTISPSIAQSPVALSASSEPSSIATTDIEYVPNKF